MTWRDNPLELYKLFVDEELKFSTMYQDRIKFFTGLLSTLVAGTVAGLFQATKWQQYLGLVFGPLVMIGVCVIARRSLSRLYQRFLEAITVRAKLEQLMGMTVRPAEYDVMPDPYWPDEPLVAPRHLESRRAHPSARAWLDANSKEGDHQWFERMFYNAEALAVLLLLAIVLFTCAKCREQNCHAARDTTGQVAAVAAQPETTDKLPAPTGDRANAAGASEHHPK